MVLHIRTSKIVLLAIAAICAASGAFAGDLPPVPDALKKAGVVRIGIKCDYPPDGFLDSQGKNQGIEVDYSTAGYSPTFTASKQSIWSSGNAFTFNFDKFFGIDTRTSSAGVTVALKAGISVGLTFNAGSFDASLPFSVTLLK